VLQLRYCFVTDLLHFENTEEHLIKKIILSFLIAVSLFAFYPLSTNVSAATLNNVDILNSINAVQTNTRYYGLGQCYGFAKKTFASIFHLDVQDVSWDYTNGTTGSTYLYSVMKTKSKSELDHPTQPCAGRRRLLLRRRWRKPSFDDFRQ
jgi:hypothetical protein